MGLRFHARDRILVYCTYAQNSHWVLQFPANLSLHNLSVQKNMCRLVKGKEVRRKIPRHGEIKNWEMTSKNS